mgnify:CR=1 FL=1
MGQAAVRPAFVPARRVLAWAGALLANAALLAAILLVPRPPLESPPLNVINLQLVAEVTPEPALQAEPEPQPEADAETVAVPPDPAPLPPAARNGDADPQTPDDAEEEEEEEDRAEPDPGSDEMRLPDRPEAVGANALANYAIAPLPESAALTGTPFVIREIFCLTSSEATREAGQCPDDPDPDGLSMLRYASDANLEAGLRAAIGHGMSPEQMRALFEAGGLPLADLSGQPTLGDTSQRPTSSADQMRDSLPPRHPDPAFRD